MPDAGVPIVFPGREKKNKDEKGKAKMVFLGIQFNELFLRSINMSQSMLMEVQGEDAVDVP